MENMDECQSTAMNWSCSFRFHPQAKTYDMYLLSVRVEVASATRAASYENSISNWRMVLSSSSLRVTKKTTQQSNAYNNGIGGNNNDDDVVVEAMLTVSGGAGMGDEVLIHCPRSEEEGQSVNDIVSHDDNNVGDDEVMEDLQNNDSQSTATATASNNAARKQSMSTWQQSINIPSLSVADNPVDHILGKINVGFKMADKMMSEAIQPPRDVCEISSSSVTDELNAFGKVDSNEDVDVDDEGETASETPASSEIDGGDDGGGNIVVESGDDNQQRWSAFLSTPSTNPLFSPSTDHNSTKKNTNLHGLGLQYSTETITKLCKAGETHATLLNDVSSLLDDLADSLSKSRTTMLLTTTSLTTTSNVESFVREVNGCVMSFVECIISLGRVTRVDSATVYRDICEATSTSSTKEYLIYISGRVRCNRARVEAVLARRKYVECVKELEGAVKTLIRAIRIARKKASTPKLGLVGSISRRKVLAVTDSLTSSLTSPNVSSSDIKSLDKEDETDALLTTTTIDDPDHATTPLSSSPPPPWEDELRKLSDKYKLSRQMCDAVIRAYDDVHVAQANYQARVVVENEAVEEVQSLECMEIDCLQRLEEDRIASIIKLIDKLLNDKKTLIEKISLDLSQEALEPLDCSSDSFNDIVRKEQLSDGNAIIISTLKTTPSSLFMNPRLRTQSDDNPAINETRQVELPDSMAEIRERMKSLGKRQMNRLKVLKLVASFNEEMTTAIDKFASGLKSRLDIGLAASDKSLPSKDGEVANVMSSWKLTVESLELLASNGCILAKQIREGNFNLKTAITGFIEREARSFQEREECRWKALCDAARVEIKARAKLKQHVAELAKAKARMANSEEGGEITDNTAGGTNISPRRPARTTKMDQQMNKAMGRMFSILPGGGEDVMNKVLTPMQRQAIVTRQLDEAIIKEGKGTESHEIARTMMQQAILSYEAEAEGAEFKLKIDERNELDLMQKSLIMNVKAMRKFRKGYLKSVMTSITMLNDMQGNGIPLNNTTGWVAVVAKRARDHRARIANDTKMDDLDSHAESGFSLKLHLAECPDVEETIRKCLDDSCPMDDFDEDTIGGSCSLTAEEDNASLSLLPDAPVDSVIKTMDPIFSKTLTNVSIDEYYKAGWSEDPPLYGPWLERKGSYDLTVSNWETSTEGGFENPWSKEKFPQKRVRDYYLYLYYSLHNISHPRCVL